MRRDRIVRQLLRESFVVTTVGGLTFRGLLADADARTIVLANAVACEPGAETPVDGLLLLPREAVAYLQKP